MTRNSRIGHWINKKKFGKRVFTSSYETKRNGDRVFNLIEGKREITFESWQAAMLEGWTKVTVK